MAFNGNIDLMITDVVMPGISGREMVEQLAKTRPTTKVLYLSGYTEDAILSDGSIEQGTAFLQKPFTLQSLPESTRSARIVDPIVSKQSSRARPDSRWRLPVHVPLKLFCTRRVLYVEIIEEARFLARWGFHAHQEVARHSFLGNHSKEPLLEPPQISGGGRHGGSGWPLGLGLRETIAPSMTAFAGNKIDGIKKSPLSTTETITPYKDVTHYNNYYEFGTSKDEPAELAKNFRTRRGR